MSKLPLVAIIGRPNTGKSTLFNRFIGSRRAIISDIPGTTRDHVTSKVEHDDLDYLLVDTGGMGGGTDDKDFEDDVHAQSVLALAAADVIVFTVNSREELTASDHEVVTLLRKKRKKHVPVILAVTKADNDKIFEEALPQFHALGIADDIIAVSALNNLGIAELEECIIDNLQKLHFKKEEAIAATESDVPRIAVIGKPNVGKSSLVNALMSETQRQTSPRLVSDVPGTTRDSTDTVIRHKDREFIFVDTAGLKRQAKTDEGIDSFAMLRSIQALEQSDVAILVLDASQAISKQDKRIAGMAVDAGKGLIILMNKSDLISKEQKEERERDLAAEFPFCRFAPVIYGSTKTRDGLLKMFDLMDMIKRNRMRRIPVKELHRWFDQNVSGMPLGPIARAKHITQAEDIPPTFVLFVSKPKQVEVSQLRFLDNRIRQTFDFQGSPIRWITKGPRER